MSTVNDTDLLLVERNGIQYQISYDELGTINDDDLLIVERGGVQYKLAAVDLDLSSGSFGTPVEVLTPVDGAGVGGNINFTGRTSDIASVDEILFEGWADESALGMTSDQYGGIPVVEGHNGRIVGLTRSGGIFYTDDDGATFTRPSHPGSNFEDICFNGSKYVAVGTDTSCKIIYSSNGHTWYQPTAPSNLETCYACAANPATGRIVVSGRANSANDSPYAYSNNGSSWTASNTTSQQSQWYMSGNVQTREIIKFGGGKWVSVERSTGGWSNYQHPEYSSDGINWYYNETSQGGFYGVGLVYAEDLGYWGMLGTYSSNATRFKTSADGETWTHNSSNISSSSSGRPRSTGPYVLAYGHGTFLYGASSFNGFFRNMNGDITSWTASYTSPQNQIIGGAFVKNKFLLASNSPRGLYFTKDMSSETYPTNLSSSRLHHSYNTMRYDLTFENSNVYNNSTGEIVGAADFVETFDRTLKRVSDGLTFYDIVEVTDGAISLTYTNLSSDFVPGQDQIRTSSSLTVYAPSPDDIEFTSQNAGTTAVTATDATLAFRKWTLETRSSSSDPWAVVTEADDFAPVGSQNGSTTWTTKPTLQPNTQYRIKVAYYSSNAREIESEYAYFTTGAS